MTESSGDDMSSDALTALSPEELERCRRFIFARDRRDFAAAHALLRATLSAHCERPYTDWAFVSSHQGKPLLAPASAGSTPLAFNLTHTRGLVACAVVSDAQVDVGIDAEAINPSTDVQGLAATFFSRPEAAHLATITPADRAARFAEIWTLKEAYVKARGDGLSHPLDTFSFDFANGTALRFDCRDSTPAQWSFFLWAPSPLHRLVLAFRDRAADRVRRVTLSQATQFDRCVSPASAILLREHGRLDGVTLRPS